MHIKCVFVELVLDCTFVAADILGYILASGGLGRVQKVAGASSGRCQLKRQAAGIFGGVQKQWQKRYCIVEEGWLMYFKDEVMKELKGRIALNEVNEVKTEGVTEEGDEVPESGAAFSFEQGGREWVFAASSEGEMKEWARKIIGS